MLALPQMKCSWMIVCGPAQMRREATRRLEIMADAYLSISAPSQRALPAWWSLAAQIQSEIKTRLDENRRTLTAVSDRHDGMAALKSAGGWNAIVHIKEAGDDEAFAVRLLKERSVLVHPGYFFDLPDEGYLVLSLLVKPAVFQEGLEHLKAILP